jgi:hypothetical protein
MLEKKGKYPKSMLEYPVANDFAYSILYDNIRVLIFIGTYLSA